MSDARPTLTLEALHTYAAWLAHAPCTVHQLAGKSDLPLISLQPRSEELHAVGALKIVGTSGNGPIYALASGVEVNAPSTTDRVERQLTTLPVRDQVSIAAGIMARHGKRGAAAARAAGHQQSALGL